MTADLPDPAAEARLDAALAPAPLDPAQRERLQDLHAPLARPAVAGRIGFGRAGVAAAAGLAAAAVLGIGLFIGQSGGTAPGSGLAASGPAVPTVSDPLAPTGPVAPTPDPLLLAMDAAAAAVDADLPTTASAEPGTVGHYLAELESTGTNPWARSAWASAESDALFADSASASTSVF